MQNRSTLSTRLWIKRSLQVLILGVTLYWIGGHVVAAYRDLQAESAREQFRFDARWLSIAVTAYAGGLVLLGVPWWFALRDFGAAITLPRAAATYVVSHSGKYVPGKAMVIVIRCAILAPGVSIGWVTLSSFYETFSTMASGSILSALSLAALPLPSEFAGELTSRPILRPAVTFLALVFGATVLPIGFSFFTRLVTIPFKAAKEYAAARVRWSTVGLAQLIGMAAWTLWGLSYLATLNSLRAEPLGLSALPMTTACVAISIVIGFVSMIPGQAGIRDWVLIEALIPVVGRPVAVVGAILFRLLTLGVELSLGAILYWGGLRR